MLTLRKSQDRGYADHGWLKSFHSFSFATTTTRRRWASATCGSSTKTVSRRHRFGTHSHRDMEIVSYVLDGALSHKDSIGNGATIVPASAADDGRHRHRPQRANQAAGQTTISCRSGCCPADGG